VPITPTYPGVYIEELPSAVHTIVGVSTSVTAFVGYTKRGPANMPTHVFSFGDFQRAFGDLDPDSPLSYAVQQFFLNGGAEAWIVRVARGAAPASVTLANTVAAGQEVLRLDAKSSGTWANSLQITVDQGTLNPESLFNLTVTEYVVSGGALVPATTESFLNATMNSYAATYAVDVINFNSKLLSAARPASFPADPGPGSSEGGTSILAGLSVPAGSRLVVSLNGNAPVEAILQNTVVGPVNIASEIQTALTAAGLAPADITSASVGGAGKKHILLTSASTDERSSVHVLPAAVDDLAQILGLGVQNGGIEIDGVAAFNPCPTGTIGQVLTDSLGGTLPDALDASGGDLTITVTVTAQGTAYALADPLTLLAQNTTFDTKEALRAGLQAALRGAALANPDVTAELAGARVSLVADQLVVSAGGRPDTTIAIAGGATANSVGFGTNEVFENLAAYSPSTTDATPILAQRVAALGADGSLPTYDTDVIGDEVAQTGLYALAHVDLFNLLVLPDAVAATTNGLSAAMAYCERRRAFLIVDLPTTVTTLSGASDWITAPSTPKSPNAAAYFPRLDFPDPMQGNRPRPMASAGAIAGLYARIDASRGIWKAPAGTEAVLRGLTGVDVPLNDPEQGTLNPLGLNVTRALPVYGNVVWGARTLYGADQLGSQWKYIPVRRLALYIEESLFRGTKWAVFEPNDEPLWAQIRLSVGSFMHNLFRQHAFEGSSPRQAYLVKCDSETTTQTDIDLGVVNIIVGFAPLKPAEFVVIQITQLAGQLDV
jgi:uncharacterized protein